MPAAPDPRRALRFRSGSGFRAPFPPVRRRRGRGIPRIMQQPHFFPFDSGTQGADLSLAFRHLRVRGDDCGGVAIPAVVIQSLAGVRMACPRGQGASMKTAAFFTCCGPERTGIARRAPPGTSPEWGIPLVALAGGLRPTQPCGPACGRLPGEDRRRRRRKPGQFSAAGLPVDRVAGGRRNGAIRRAVGSIGKGRSDPPRPGSGRPTHGCCAGAADGLGGSRRTVARDDGGSRSAGSRTALSQHLPPQPCARLGTGASRADMPLSAAL